MRTMTCRSCGARVIWALTLNRRWLALNPDPDAAGNQASHRDGRGTRLTRQLGKDDQPHGYERRYMPHVATCKTPAGLDVAPAELPPNVIPFRQRAARAAASPIPHRTRRK